MGKGKQVNTNREIIVMDNGGQDCGSGGRTGQGRAMGKKERQLYQTTIFKKGWNTSISQNLSEVP